MNTNLRCAACGSPRVVVDHKSEGYSLSKGVAGSLLLGPGGAVAGINGKKSSYYHCPDCGQTLSYSMGSFIVKMINEDIENPNERIESLRKWKKEYPNIEWEDSDNESEVQTLSKEDKSFSVSEMLRKEIYPKSNVKLVEQLIQRIKLFHDTYPVNKISLTDLEAFLGSERYADDSKASWYFHNGVWEACEELSGDEREEPYLQLINKYYETYIVFLSDEDRKKKSIEKQYRAKYEYLKQEGKIDELKQFLIKNISPNKGITITDMMDTFMENIRNVTGINDVNFLKFMLDYTLSSLQSESKVDSKKTQEGLNEYTFLDEEGRKKELERKDQEKNRIEEQERIEELSKSKIAEDELKKNIQKVHDFFNLFKEKFITGKECYPVMQITTNEFKGGLLGSYKSQEIKRYLYLCLSENLLEFDSETFSLPNVHKDLRKQAIEQSREKIIELENSRINLNKQLEDINRQKDNQSKIYEENSNKKFWFGKKEMKVSQEKICVFDKTIEEINKKSQIIDDELEKERCILRDLENTKVILSSSDRFAQLGLKKWDEDDFKLARDIFEMLVKKKMPMSHRMVCDELDCLYGKDERRVLSLLLHMLQGYVVGDVEIIYYDDYFEDYEDEKFYYVR